MGLQKYLYTVLYFHVRSAKASEFVMKKFVTQECFLKFIGEFLEWWIGRDDNYATEYANVYKNCYL